MATTSTTWKCRPGKNVFVFDALAAVPSAHEQSRPFPPAEPVDAVPPRLLRYTLPSRYIDSDELMDFAFQLFGAMPRGAAQVQAIADWVHENVEYRTGAGSPTRTARQTIDGRFGVCRDFAHALVALCRCMNYPARYVSGYLPDIGCPDPGARKRLSRLRRGVPRRPLAHVGRAVQHTAHRSREDLPWPRRRGHRLRHDLWRGVAAVFRGVGLPSRSR